MPEACDSMCTSLARDSIASSRISFTSRTTDASWAISDSSEPSVSMSLSSSTSSSSSACGQQAVDRLAADAEVRLDQPGDLVAGGQHRLTVRPVAALSSSSGYRSNGSRVATTSGPLSLAERKQRLAVDQLLRKALEQRQIDVGLRPGR